MRATISSDPGVLRGRMLAASAFVIVMLAAACGLFLAGGVAPFDGLRSLVSGAVGSRQNLGESLIRMTPIALIALGLIPSLRAGLFNIGSPGQFAAGALAATMISLIFESLPSALLLVVAAVAGMVGGALWALIPAILRAVLDINEILTTLVFNFLATFVLAYLLGGPLQGKLANLAQSDPFPPAAQLPILLPNSRAHVGVLLILVVGLVVFAFNRTPAGYRLRLFGANKELARQGGVHERQLIISLMTFGGGAAGLAGWVQVAGVDHRLYATVSEPVGYYGFFAALLGLLVPLLVIASSFGLGALLHGGSSLQIGVGIAPEIVEALIGVVLFLVVIRGAFARGERRR